MEDNQQYELPQPFWCYKRAFQTLTRSKVLFRQLLVDHAICLRCIFRLYGFEQPRLYSDPSFAIETLPALLNSPPEDDLMRRYKPGQWGMAEVCWLCAGVLQRGVVSGIVEESVRLIKEKGYGSWGQFKLNIRIPNLIILRSLLLARHLYAQARRSNDPALAQLYYNILVLPIDANKVVEHKTILKWILAHELAEQTGMGSTSDESDQNLVISVEVELQNDGSEAALMRVFSSYLGLEKKKEKAKGRKAAIDLGEERTERGANHTPIHPQEYRCNANNMAKIIQLRQAQFDSILAPLRSKEDFYYLATGSAEPSSPSPSYKVVLLTKNVYLCGRYIKYSRYLSQTPWVVDGKKLTEGSLQEEIEDRIFPLFYPGRTKDQIEIRFHSGGREDIDVRMLKGGRPFVLEFVNPIRSVANVTLEQALALAPASAREELSSAFSAWGSGEQHHSWRLAKMLQLLINHDAQYVQVLDFQQTTESFISIDLKAAETEKIKHYLCYIYSVQPLSQQDKTRLQAVKDLTLQQLTPLRVLHRRTLMNREKTIHRLKMHLVSGHSAVLEVWASAGTYIKEFVHGDLGRTLPNIGSLLGKEVDILQLDVGSLKEGEWRAGDEELMKMERFEWMD